MTTHTPHDSGIETQAAGDVRLTTLLLARYGATAPNLDVWNETLKTVLGHRSVRHYRPDPLPEGTIELLVAAGQSAASSSNLQAWSVIAVEDSNRKARLAALAGEQAQITQAPLFLVWLVDLHRLETIGRLEDSPSEGLQYLESFLLGAVDATLAAQNAVIALESIGLGAVYIGAIRNNPEKVARELALPPHVFPLFGLTVGYPDPTIRTAVKPRLSQEAVLFRETYALSEITETTAFNDYNLRLKHFQTKQHMSQRNWTETVARRLHDAASLHGRDRLAAALRNMGFGLK